MNMEKTETGHGHGAVFTSPLKRKLRRVSKLAGAGAPVVWNRQPKLPLYAIKNQNGSFSCGGQAGSRLIEILSAFHGTQIPEQSAKSVYAPISYPDGGTSVRDLVRQISQLGSNNESEVTSYQDGRPPSEAWMINRQYQTSELLKSALLKSGWVRISVRVDIESMAQAIRDYGAVLIEIQAQNNGTWRTAYPKPPNKVDWAHFMCSQEDGYSTGINGKQIAFYQSWGQDVGVAGIQFLTEEYINSGYIVDCFTLAPDTKVQQSVILNALMTAYQKLASLLRLKQSIMV
jgi:hypothetical protein